MARRLTQAEAAPEAALATLDCVPNTAAAPAVAGPTLLEATEHAYWRDWHQFAAWCRAQAIDPMALPTPPALVAAYLASVAPRLGHSALRGRLAAIAHAHRRWGETWDAGHPAIRAALQAAGRQHGKPVRPAAPLTPADIEHLLAPCPDDLAGLRDRTLLLLGFAAGLRRSALVAVDHAHLCFAADGVTLQVPQPHYEGRGPEKDLILPRRRDAAGMPSETCPVRALERWLARARIRRGPVFRSITAGGRLGDRLSPDGVRRILLRRAALATLAVPPGQRLSPHGLRAGCAADVTRAAIQDGPATAPMRPSGQ